MPEVPFREPLVETGFTTEIKSLQNNPEKIVRFNPLLRSVEETVERYNTSKNLFYELRDHYGVAVPNIETLIGYNEKGEKSVIIVTERVHGSNLDKLSLEGSDGSTIKQQFDNFFNNMVQYYLDKSKHQSLYVGDLKNEQFVYGRRKDETIDQVYYVDIEPFFRAHNPTAIEANFFNPLISLTIMMDRIEAKFFEAFGDSFPFEFKEAREKIISFTDELSVPSDPYAITDPAEQVSVLRNRASKGVEERIQPYLSRQESSDVAGWGSVDA